VETGSSAAMSAMGSRLGLVGMLLMISGIGCRCGLAPWSLGRGDADRTAPFAQSIVDQWLGEFAGLIMLLRVVLMMQGRYAQPIFLLLSIAGAGTALWLGISLVGEGKIRPLLRKISAIQFSGLVLFTALLTASHWPAVHPARVILGADVVLTGWAVWIVTFTLTITGLTALLLRLGIQDQQELYFENFVGLFSRRPWEGGLLAGWLLSVSCAIPVALFWPRWLSWIMAATMPLNTAEGSLSPNPVAFAAMACYFVAGLVQLAVIGRWTRSILLDPAISLPAGSPSRWQLVLAIAAGALCLAGGIQPGLLWNFWLGSGR
jgi:hypothetical protein